MVNAKASQPDFHNHWDQPCRHFFWFAQRHSVCDNISTNRHNNPSRCSWCCGKIVRTEETTWTATSSRDSQSWHGTVQDETCGIELDCNLTHGGLRARTASNFLEHASGYELHSTFIVTNPEFPAISSLCDVMSALGVCVQKDQGRNCSAIRPNFLQADSQNRSERWFFTRLTAVRGNTLKSRSTFRCDIGQGKTRRVDVD